MKKQCNSVAFSIMNILLMCNLLCYFGIRSMWSGIVRYTFKAMPYILLVVLIITVLATTAFSMLKKYPLLIMIWGCIINLLFLGLDAYIISLTTEATYYFIREFLYGLSFIAAISALIFSFTYITRRSWFHKPFTAPALMILLFLAGIISVFKLTPFNGINRTPVVYAVGDTYQICFTTVAKGEAWVEINGVEYNDTFAGYRYTEETIHKITVPMEALDNAGSYTVYTRAMYLRGPYESLQGPTISKTIRWKGVSTEDGLNYYVISDTHNTVKTPAAAAGYWGESLDFLICAGDTASWLDRESDLTTFLYLAADITKGEIPVIYARGNHETKGILAKDYYRYVGCDGGNYYYTFRLKNIWGIVLDMGEDHADDFVEYCDISRFNAYREEQTAFLDTVLANAESEFEAEGVDYRIGVCHIPLTINKKNDYAAPFRDAWLDRLNQMNLTIMYSGHVHELWFIDPAFEDGMTLTEVVEYSGKASGNSKRIMTDATFPSILVSKRGELQSPLDPEKVFDTGFIGLAVKVEGNETVMMYTDEEKNLIETISPWFSNIKYGKEIRIQNR